MEWVSRARGGDGRTGQGLEAVLGKAASCLAALVVSSTQQIPQGNWEVFPRLGVAAALSGQRDDASVSAITIPSAEPPSWSAPSCRW